MKVSIVPTMSKHIQCLLYLQYICSIYNIYGLVIMRPIKVSMFKLQKFLAPRARQPQLAVPGQGGRGQGSQQPEKEGEINEKQTGKSCEGGNKS